jgi:hypothetical protein
MCRINGDILVGLSGPRGPRYMACGGKKVDFGSLRFKRHENGWSLFARGFELD